jgi:hypothetical protein
MVLDRHRMVKVEWSVGRHYCQHQLMTRCDDFVVVELDHDVSSFDDYYYYCSSKNHPSRVERCWLDRPDNDLESMPRW